MWTLHQFCYLSILWWAEDNPSSPSARGVYCQSSNHFSWTMTAWRMSPHPLWVIHQVGVALDHPAAQDLHHSGAPQRWASRRNAQVSCGWHPASVCSLYCFQNYAMLLQRLQPWIHQDGDIWQQCWMSHSGRHHQNYPNQTQDECRAVGLDAGSVPPKLHSDIHTAARVCRCAMQQQKGQLLSCCSWGSWQPPLNSHCHQVRLCPGLQLPDGKVNAPLKGHSNSWREGKETHKALPPNKNPAPHQWCWKVPWNMAKAGLGISCGMCQPSKAPSPGYWNKINAQIYRKSLSVINRIDSILTLFCIFYQVGWNVNPDGSFYLCQVLHHCSSTGKHRPAPGLQLWSWSGTRVSRLGSPEPAPDPLPVSSSLYLLLHVPGLCSPSSLHCLVQPPYGGAQIFPLAWSHSLVLLSTSCQSHATAGAWEGVVLSPAPVKGQLHMGQLPRWWAAWERLLPTTTGFLLPFPVPALVLAFLLLCLQRTHL